MITKEEVAIFNEHSGNILRMALSVESQLEFFIANYFIKPQTAKTFFLKDVMLIQMNFEKKKNLFKLICQRENVDKVKLSSALNSVDFVQTIRNKIAHWQSEIPSKGIIQLRNRRGSTTERDILQLNEELVKQVDKERLNAVTIIGGFHTECYRNGTIDEKPNPNFKI